MRVLVTGAGGFIGARVARALLAGGHEVIALTRRRAAPRLDGVVDDRLSRAVCDLADRDRLRGVLAAARPQACVHAAWYAEPGKYLHARENLDCLAVSLSLVEELAAADCGRVVGVGTCAEYDTSAGGPLHEDGPTAPATLYAAAKLSLCHLGARLGVPWAWARVFYLYGPGEDSRRLLPGLLDAAKRGRRFAAGSGTAARDFLHVDDVAAGLVALAESPEEGVFNVCSGEGVTVRRFLETAAGIAGRPDVIKFGAAPPRQWDPPVIVGDDSRLRSLGWRPRFGLIEGLRDAAGCGIVTSDIRDTATPRPADARATARTD